mmetsp:Transcript_82272/g.214704  ORF Transcript_82272/g.214704 Transcript_82272/m.214704 type:complete len:240 (-) Transcript_82272:8-727(-)
MTGFEEDGRSEGVASSSSLPRGGTKDQFGRKVPAKQSHYMRSAARNPGASTSSFWENPKAEAHFKSMAASTDALTDKERRFQEAQCRPVNKRNYWSPAHWVQSVEAGEATRLTKYTDWQFTEEFNRIWKDHVGKEQRAMERAGAPAGSEGAETRMLQTEYAGSFVPKLGEPGVPVKRRGLATSSSAPLQALPSHRVSFSHSQPWRRAGQAPARARAASGVTGRPARTALGAAAASAVGV